MSEVRDIDILKTWCLSSTLNFTRYFFKHRFKRKFVIGQHHVKIAAALDDVLAGKIKKLIINIAPRYGKTELAVKNFIAEGLALNPRSKFIHLSYSDDLARDNSMGVQEIMNQPEYKQLFEAAPTSPNTKKWYTKEGGGLYAVSSAGQVTGFGAGLVDIEETEEEKQAREAQEQEELDEFLSCIGADEKFGGAIIIDDPIKPDDALSSLVREKVNNKFDTTIRNRVNSRNTPIIIIMQRLHENDLCGHLIEREPDEWTVLSLPCIYNDDEGNECALWSFKQTLDELKKERQKNAFVFDTQYMQNPKPLEGLMYENTFRVYDVIPYSKKMVKKAYIDTADEGKDYLCAITYVETETANYILDILYTQKPMEYTEPKTAELLSKHGIIEAVIESNNGGRGFARAVEKQCRIMGNNLTKFKWFHQGDNKNIRIFSNSAAVMNLTYFPKGWEHLFPEFYKAITSYMKVGKNDHDDAPDALTGTVERRKKGNKQDLNGLFG
jgi:predicted phage terminase large subunit-like protein